MSSLENTARLTKRAVLTNLFMPKGLAVTPLLAGSHGIGKSMIVHTIAKSLGGESLVIEGGSLKEGELTGLPFQATGADGRKEVDFVPHYQIAKIQRLQKSVYESAVNGLLGGDVRIDPETKSEYYKAADGETKEIAKSKADVILSGDVNEYAFGEELPGDVKLRLLTSGEVTPVIILIDEMNRTDNQTMKEMMNIVLTRNINGYNLPWWVFFVSAINPCGQNSIYSTNDMDAAQLDRFLKINVSADLDEWINYAIDKADEGKGLDQDYITALANSSEIFNSGAFKSDGDEEPDATPRSHEICAYIWRYAGIINQTRFFTQEERGMLNDDLRLLINAKLGSRAGRTLLSAIKNKDNYIDCSKLIDMKSADIAPEFKKKISEMRPIAQRFLLKNILKYIAREGAENYFLANDDKAKPDAIKAAKVRDANMIAQLKAVQALIGEVTLLTFAKEAITTKYDLPQSSKYYSAAKGGSNKNRNTIWLCVARSFNVAIMEQIKTFTENATHIDD